MKKDLLSLGAIFAAAGGITALAIKTIKKRKEEVNEEPDQTIDSREKQLL